VIQDDDDPGPSVSYETLAALLRLSELRSQFRVGMAMLDRFPEETDWEAATRAPDFLESLDALTEIVDDIRLGHPLAVGALVIGQAFGSHEIDHRPPQHLVGGPISHERQPALADAHHAALAVG
jgi:hypothetical protein